MRATLMRLTPLALMALHSVACATFPAEKIPSVAVLPVPDDGAARPSAHIALRFLTDLSGGKNPPIEQSAPLPTLREIVGGVADKTDIFSSYSFDSFDTTDYIVQFEVTNHGSVGAAAAAGIITGLTLFIIPSAATDNYTIEAKVRARGGPVLRYYCYEDAMTTWIGIWLLPVAFNTPQSAFNGMLENGVRAVFRDMIRDHVFEPGTEAAPIPQKAASNQCPGG